MARSETSSVIDLEQFGRDRPVRVSVRFPMELAICLHTQEGQTEAMSVNISANGVLFSGPRLPEVDSPVEFTMRMPGEVMGYVDDLLVHCRGRIVRHERRVTFDLAAAVIDEYVFKA